MPKVDLRTSYNRAYDADTEAYEVCFRSAMLRKRMRQSDLAKKLGKSQPTVSNWLNDLDSVNLGDLRRMANHLGLTITINEGER